MSRPMYGLERTASLHILLLLSRDSLVHISLLRLLKAHTLEDVKLCNLRFSSVRQLGPDWAVFAVFMFTWATIVDECYMLKGIEKDDPGSGKSCCGVDVR